MGPLLLFLLGRSVLTDIRRTASDSLCVRLISQVVFGAFEAVHEPSGSSGPYKLVKLVTIHPYTCFASLMPHLSHNYRLPRHLEDVQLQ